jgi:hypothetical protein
MTTRGFHTAILSELPPSPRKINLVFAIAVGSKVFLHNEQFPVLVCLDSAGSSVSID